VTGLKGLYAFFIYTFVMSSSFFSQHESKTEFLVAIDIGHSQNRPGTISARGINEYVFNKGIGELLHVELNNHRLFRAFITERERKKLSLSDRAAIANSRSADIFISIHHDSVQPHYLSLWEYDGKKHFYCDHFQGFSLFYSQKNNSSQDSLFFSQLLGDELLKAGFKPTLHHAEKIKGENRALIDSEKGIYKFDNLIVLKKTRMPAVLLECGIIVNREEEKKLSTLKYQRNIVDAIIKAIERYYLRKATKS